MPTGFESYLTARSQKMQDQRAAEASKRAGAEHKSLLDYRGLQMEKVAEGMRREKRNEKRAENISMLTGAAMTATSGENRQSALNALGAVDLGAAQETQTFFENQSGADTRRREAAADMFGDSLYRLEAMPQGQQIEAGTVMIAKAVESGFLQPAEADQLSDLLADDATVFIDVARKSMGIDGGDKRLPAAGLQTFTNPETGEIVRIDTTTPEGRQQFLELDPGFRKPPTRQETGTPGSFEGKAAEAAKQRDRESSTGNYLMRGENLVDDLLANPDANTVAGSLARMGTNLLADANALARASGVGSFIDDIEDYNATEVASVFEELGIDNANLQGQIISLAYLQAKIQDPGGRVTNADFKAALRSLGADNSNPKAFAKTLTTQMKLAEKAFKMDWRIRNDNQEYTGNFGRSDPTAADDEELPRPKSAAERDALPKGTRYIAPNGEIGTRK